MSALWHLTSKNVFNKKEKKSETVESFPFSKQNKKKGRNRWVDNALVDQNTPNHFKANTNTLGRFEESLYV